MKNIISLLALALVFLTSCDKARVYETNLPVKNGAWAAKDSMVFDFNIEDNAAAYNLFYTIRYSKDLPYYNLYVRHFLSDSTGKVLKTELMNMDLFDAKTGKPLGSGMGDVYDYRVLFMKDYQFPYKGKYKLIAKQYMRDEPLKGISDFGLRVDKATK